MLQKRKEFEKMQFRLVVICAVMFTLMVGHMAVASEVVGRSVNGNGYVNEGLEFEERALSKPLPEIAGNFLLLDVAELHELEIAQQEEIESLLGEIAVLYARNETLYEKNEVLRNETVTLQNSYFPLSATFAGYFTLTAYCPCSICCGRWAYNRPRVGNRYVVATASQAFAEPGVTIAVDTSVLPFGTKVYIEGVGVRVAQDTGSGVNGNHIDVYFATHDEARHFFHRNVRVWILDENFTKG